MPQFVAMDQRVEVNGETVRSVLEGMGSMKALGHRILAKSNITEPAPGRWYPQQAWLSAFKEISEGVGPTTLYLIGQSIPKTAQFPPEIDSIEKALKAIDIAYHMNHRLGGKVLFDGQTGAMSEGIGHYQCSEAGPRKMRVVCANPYPCDFDRGIIEAMAKRFKPADCALVQVTHEATCRKKGQDHCACLVDW